MLWIAATLVAAQLSAGERIPIVAVVLTPREAATTFTVSDARDALTRAVLQNTPFTVLAADPPLEHCAGSLSCIVTGLREFETPESAPILAVVLSQRPDRRIVASVFNLPRAAIALAKGRAEMLPDNDLDSHLYEQAMVAEAAPVLLTELPALESHLVALMARAWSASPDLEARGTVVVGTSTAPLVVELDGRPIGASTSTTIVIADVRPGQRRVGLSHPKATKAIQDLTVEPGLNVRIAMPVTLLPDRRFPHATVWPAVGLLGAGAAFIAIGAHRATGLSAACLNANADECASTAGFARVGAGDAAGVGPLAVPLGYSLVLAGVSYGVTRLVQSDDTPWWVAPLVALGVGTLSYGVSEIAASRVE